MSNKPLKVLFFLVVFAVPVGWYLFLQAFGENKFELDPIRQIPDSCGLRVNHFLLIERNDFSVSEMNQLNRIIESSRDQNVSIEKESMTCFDTLDANALVLLDDSNQIRGVYNFEILEIDRAIVELDLMLTLQNE